MLLWCVCPSTTSLVGLLPCALCRPLLADSSCSEPWPLSSPAGLPQAVCCCGGTVAVALLIAVSACCYGSGQEQSWSVLVKELLLLLLLLLR